LSTNPEEEAKVERRHAKFYTHFVKQREEDLKGVRIQGALAEVEQEFANIRAAWWWAVRHRDHGALEDAIWAFWAWIESRGDPASIYPLFEQAVAAWDNAGSATPKGQAILAKLRVGAAWARFRLDGSGQPVPVTQKSLRLLEKYGGQPDIALVNMILGGFLVLYGKSRQARSHLRTSRKMCRELGDRWCLEGSIFYLGEIAWSEGDLREARRHYQETLAICESVGHVTGNIFCLRRLGDVAEAEGDLKEARRLYKKSLTLAEDMDNARQRALLLLKLGKITRRLGEHHRAWLHTHKAVQIASDALLTPVVLDGLTEIGQLLHDLGRDEEAAQLISVVREHPSGWRETRQQAEALHAELTACLTADVIADAEEHAKACDLDAVLAELWDL
jgi:tetratricopeptide (TPR) repeat protein